MSKQIKLRDSKYGRCFDYKDSIIYMNELESVYGTLGFNLTTTSRIIVTENPDGLTVRVNEIKIDQRSPEQKREDADYQRTMNQYNNNEEI